MQKRNHPVCQPLLVGGGHRTTIRPGSGVGFPLALLSRGDEGARVPTRQKILVEDRRWIDQITPGLHHHITSARQSEEDPDFDPEVAFE
ncbi:hypothetical protein SORBI_3001G173150 [Sorghum bicolor]|uniref:Uncharacterized protein n=1 Tax=Sorghum bicolor TaxID=4558 RepID=A0A1Z5S636_SORBI|nr:hypothetical protein SORBI_3001G173150 [Sorghum bicolor]